MVNLATIFIGIVLFSAMSIGLFTFYGDLVSKYPDYYNSTSKTYYGEVYQQINETFDLSADISDTLKNKTNAEATSEASAILGATSSLRLVWNSFNSVNKLTQAVAYELGVPNWVVKTFLTIFLVVVAFAIIDAIFRR